MWPQWRQWCLRTKRLKVERHSGESHMGEASSGCKHVCISILDCKNLHSVVTYLPVLLCWGPSNVTQLLFLDPNMVDRVRIHVDLLIWACTTSLIILQIVQ